VIAVSTLAWSLLVWSDLQWIAPAECPSEAEVAVLVDAELRAIAGETRKAVRVEARASPSEVGVRLEVRVETGRDIAIRVVDLQTCAESASAVALIVSLVLGEAAREPPHPFAEPAVVPPPPPRATPEPAPERPQPATSPMGPPLVDAPELPPPTRLVLRPRLALVVSGAARLGLLNRPTGTLGVSVGALWRWVRIDVGFDYGVRARVESTTVGGSGAFVSTYAARVRVGPTFPLGPVAIPMLAQVEAGAIEAAPYGVLNGHAELAPWCTVGVGTGIQWPIRPYLALTLGAEVSAAVVRNTFVLGESTALLRLSPWGGAVRLDLEARFF